MKKSYRLMSGIAAGALLLGGMMVQSAFAQLQDATPGSFLVYPLFDISGTNQTKIRITNNGVLKKDVRLLAVCPGFAPILSSDICEERDSKITLTSHATKVIDVATGLFPPCSQGFIVAYALGDPDANGIQSPISYNALYGSYQVIYTAGTPTDTTTEAAQAIVNQSPQPALTVLGIDDGSGNLRLRFGGPIATADYQALPTSLLSDFAAIGGTPATGVTETDTRVILVNMNTFSGGSNNRQTVTLSTWDEAENGPFSETDRLICWSRQSGTSAFTKAPTGAITTNYGSLRIQMPDNNVNSYLGAIEEVSTLPTTQRGNTIRNMFHAGSRTTVVNFTTTPE